MYKKIGIGAIATTLLVSVLGETRTQVKANTTDIAVLNERNKSVKEILLEIKQDVKELRKERRR